MKVEGRTDNKEMEILIVEDSPTQAEELKYILEKNHFHVSVANNGKEALVMLAERKPSLVLSDIVMPEMDGYELCKHIKTDDNLSDIPVVLVTTLSSPRDVTKALECGANNFITKPYDEGFLLSRIQHINTHTQLQHTRSTEEPLEISIAGESYHITSDRTQILELLLSTYELAIQRNEGLAKTQEKLENLNKKLITSNKELESFSYSVSHDLRSPLRSMNGFSKILLEEHADGLDEHGKDYLQRVCKASQKMANLIDDLLTLSRLSRQGIKYGAVNLSRLAGSIVRELKETEPERQVEFDIKEGVVAYGDADLLSIVLDNLLRNAWKFTGKKSSAKIELGVTHVNGEAAYFVRDDGVGFDMVYVDKLFGAFQRLHSENEFSGTGIGLATVRRIINRHGGRIWAEGEVDKGATFYFTIPRI